MTPTFDASIAYLYGSVVEIAYRLFAAGDLDPSVPAAQLPPGWSVVTDVTAIDRVARKTEPEFFGLVVQSAVDSSVLIAIRGTDTLLEWVIDAEFKPTAFPGLAAAGKVEDGFCSVYSTLTCVSTGASVPSFVTSLPTGTKLTIAGHSLGAAVATLLAAEVAATVPGIDLTLYTYASPRVGDSTFAGFCTAHIPVHFRIVNRPDLVPKLPPAYDATGTEMEFDSTSYPVVRHSLACYHTLTTYLWLLNQQSTFGLGKCQRSSAVAR
jgi:triacylglycerol lipase